MVLCFTVFSTHCMRKAAVKLCHCITAHLHSTFCVFIYDTSFNIFPNNVDINLRILLLLAYLALTS